MKAFILVMPNGSKIINGGYYSIYEKGETCQRELHITDDSGGKVVLHNEQIGELLDLLKPALMG